MSRSTAHSASSVTLPTPKERRRLREALALSEEQVAEAMGVTKATVRSWETGRSAPRGRKREAYAKLLGSCEPIGAPTSPESPAGTDSPEHRPQTRTAQSRPGAGNQAEIGAGNQAEIGAGNQAEIQAEIEPPSQSQAGAGARAEAQVRAGARAEARAPAPAPAPTPAPGRSSPSRPADMRPQAAARRAAKPPKGPRKGVTKPQERLKPMAAEAPEAAPEPAVPGLTPEEAFDELYAHAAPGLVHQTYLLTGRRGLSREAVEYAFHRAWERWPEVAVDADPVGWVRAASYEYALSPWHRLRRAHKHPDAPPAEAHRRALLAALLELPPPYRRTVLLYDGLGLDLPDTAAETEASTPAAANRLLHARTVLARRVPELAEPETLHRQLGALVAEEPTATLPAARSVRAGSERRSRAWTRAVIGATAVLIAVTGFAAVTAPTRYIPVNAPGETVNGVPVRGGPQQLRPEDLELRERLRAEPNPGPERLVPTAE
ncbi:sigma factor-like helix-turn-helix DNA-binding protein [Streptomyces sp. NPDC048266]|uniref:sigma factor-like helix-turn-helix DNA-binding protein n=1 Tax=Streptomyces sp. NPDC048266 TaxID=3155787 RepID=UPI00340A965E